ncbi:glyoxalase family protein [Aspergillus clavatus NRRL 1]|uniref:Glyoxalase family protein n=1 Tax=Aspergillus clavatus (strain ATCC 1007 / CBS 513.65 / DSM 816 / NCTC 3887 / NRRL 1 / QM 1276 / 107) TaxID=344612 RepID=A1CJ70_ASPCL|nr:glyoxalase family protein [Aspergillus clavatus NRRL 1]EAW09194.1 glyoxalase family protein [Aspergillus clavatus NRRL 1]
MPLSHLTLTVSHLPTSTSFFLSCLQPLGYQFIGRHDDYIGFGQNSGEPADFWITEQKPGSPAGAAHVAFPAPSKDAVGAFFINALKAGGKLHGEPKMRDAESGYYSAAIIDFDGNSIEAVYRPGAASVARSEVSAPSIGLLENGSVVSRASTKVSSVKAPSVAPSTRSDAKSYVSRATTAVERGAPSERGIAPSERMAPTVISREIHQPAPSPTYIVHHTTQQTTEKKDDSTAKTIVGSLLGAAAGAAIAYAMTKSDSPTTTSEMTPPPQYSPRDIAQLIMPSPSSQAPSAAQEYQGLRAIEAPPARSTYSRSDARSTLSRSVSSKNPRASTIYEGTEFIHPRGDNGSVYLDENGRRTSEGSVYSTRELPLRAIEYPPPARSNTYPSNASTLISSFPDRSRAMDNQSVYSASTAKPSKASHQDDHRSTHSSARQSSHHSAARSQLGSTASSNRTARQIPLPEGSVASFATYRTAAKSSASSARDIPLPESVIDFDVQTHVTPDDSISQIDVSRRSSYSHQSHHSKAPSHVSRRSSKFDEPVRPSDSVSQVSTNVSKSSQRTVKASGSIAGGGSRAPSKVSSRRGSQVA